MQSKNPSGQTHSSHQKMIVKLEDGVGGICHIRNKTTKKELIKRWDRGEKSFFSRKILTAERKRQLRT